MFASCQVGAKRFNESSVPLRNKNSLSIIAAESDIGRCRKPVDDAAQFLALRIHDPDSASVLRNIETCVIARSMA